MSLGSISYKTHRDIALAANTIAMALANVQTREELIEKYKTGAHIITSNCGEGGDVHDHLVKQFASARFGNTLEYIANGLILQYKASQGVKPGLGGALSALKVTELIAWLRKATPWTELYSPATNPDQFSIEELAELCRFYSTPDSILSIKLTAHPGVGSTIIGAVKSMLLSRLGARCRITITGEGSTGNTPTTTKYHAAFPWVVGVHEAHKILTENGMRDSVYLCASGGFSLNFADAFYFGADRVEIATLALTGDGCNQQRICHTGGCTVGVATNAEQHVKNNQGTPLSIARALLLAAQVTAKKLYPFTNVESAIGMASEVLEADCNGPIMGHDKYLKKPTQHFISLGKLPLQPGPSYQEKLVLEEMRQGTT